jgi:hypothetical protein
LNFQTDLWLGLAGIILPLTLGFFHAKTADKNETPVYQREFLGHSSGWIGALILSTGIIVRLLQLGYFSHWPSPDESTVAYYSLKLFEKWDWKVFFGSGQHPPLFNWGLALLFKVLGPSLFSMRLFSVSLSILSVCIAYLTTRRFFPGSYTLFFLFGSALSFWPLYLGQFCFSFILLHLWEIIALGLLLALAQPGTVGKPAKSLLLGLFTGAGLFVNVAWPLMVLFTAVMVILFSRKERGQNILLPFLVPATILISLFLVVSTRAGYGQHIHHLLIFGTGTDWGRQFFESVSNILSLFWGSASRTYGPTWGGMLNPVLSSMFLLGMLECKRWRSKIYIQWLVLSLLLFWAPGIMTNYFDIFRLTLMIPMILLAAGLGFQALITWSDGNKKWVLIPLILIPSVLLDLHHLQVSSPNNSIEAGEFSKAYDILDRTRRQNGPGRIFLDLRPNLWDKTLVLAAYPFNDAYRENPSLPKSRWAAVVVNGNYRPFLSIRFPDAQWYDLGQDQLWGSGGLMLAVIPLAPGNQAVLQGWSNANRDFRSAVDRIMDSEPFISTEEIVQILTQTRPGAEPDPFLMSCYCEKMVFSQPLSNDAQRVNLLEDGVKKGYPLPIFLAAENQSLSRHDNTAGSSKDR